MSEAAPPPLTQEVGSSKVQYAWVILFNYDINESNPFGVYPLSLFVGTDFPWKAVKGVLSSEFRKEIRSFSNIPGKEFNIFAKIEVGELYNIIINNLI